ncbi:MAG: glycosyltransferase [Actinomycetota bacterium]|nr:glycosyltransferase [Actinomycetota bacterium]
MRICLVYDRLHPLTLGGAERWLRDLAEALATRGHDVTYLTLRHWERSVQAEIPGVRVIVVGPRLEAYNETRRRMLPPLVFGLCVFWHLLRHGRSYDAVHSISFPYFSVLAAGALRKLGGYRLVVDWFEVWTREYWVEYVGRVAGTIGWAIQRLCLAFTQHAFCFSRLHAARLRQEGYRGRIEILAGLYTGPPVPARPRPPEPVVVFAGRHIPEKRVPAIVPAIALAREQVPELRCEIYGDGPEQARVQRLVAEHQLEDAVRVFGFVDRATVDDALERALCLVLPSRREGYGLVVVEASARGTPSVVVREPDNAAVELVDDGENGVIAASAAPADLAQAILRVHAAGPALREATAAWFADHAGRLTLESSLARVVASYERSAADAPAPASARS